MGKHCPMGKEEELVIIQGDRLLLGIQLESGEITELSAL